jgi:hypothetical protein
MRVVGCDGKEEGGEREWPMVGAMLLTLDFILMEGE